MPFINHEKIKTKKTCNSPEHLPPTHVYLPPGKHTYRCTACGEETIISIPEVTC